MTNDQTAMLARYGIDYAEAMERFCGNESLFARIAVKYLANTVPAKMTTQQTIDIGVGIVPCNTSANRTAQAE